MTFLDCIWRSSWQAAVIAAIVLIVRAASGSAVRPNWRLALWTLVLLRLILPILPASRMSLFGITELLRKPSAASSDLTATQSSTSIEVHYGGIDGLPLGTAGVSTIAATASRSVDARFALTVLWLCGAVALLVRLVTANLLFACRLRRESRDPHECMIRQLDSCRRDLRMSRSPRLLVTDAVDAPAVAGLVRPTILIPTAVAREMPERQLRLILLHELAHVKCLDIAIDWVWALVGAVHWFNPMLWFARSRYRADRELARDAMVLFVTGAAEAEGYGRTILQLVQIARPLRLCPGLVGMADGKTELRRRIAMIAQFKIGRSRFSWLGMMLFTIAGCAALTDSRADEPTKQPVTPSPAVAPSSPTPTAPPVARAVPVAPSAPTPTPAPADPRDVDAQAKLARVIPEVNFAAVPLSDTIDFLRDLSQANIFVNWKALEAAGIDRSTAVTARLRDVKFSKALRTILTDASGGSVKLDYALDEGVITISTAEDLNRNVVTRVYDVRDLLTTVPDFDEENPTTAPTTRPASAAEALVGLLQETVAPDTWRAKGGSVGRIQELSGQLIITQTPENQAEIVRLLDQLRQGRGVQISVEARFIWLEDAMIEKLSPALQKALKSAWETRAATGTSGMAFLSEEQVKELMTEVTSDVRTVATLAAPRLTLFNGQHASVKIATNRPYVASVQAKTGADGKVTYEPQMKQIETGLTLDTRATASADRKYVTLTLHPLLQRLTDVKTEPAPGVPPEANVTVEHPVYVTRELRTTVSVPDGGTALIGGLPMEHQAESTEPANRGLTDSAVAPLLQPAKGYHLYLLVRPTLLLQREREQEQFPLIEAPPAKPSR